MNRSCLLRGTLGLTITAVLLSVTRVNAADSTGPAVGENVARGAKYTLSPKPDYNHCTDPDDTIQLTDGQTTQEYFWTQKGTVGWKHRGYVIITIDLGKVEPIAGVSYRTAAGTAGVFWPAAIRIHVSDDGKAYRDVGDLLVLDDAGKPLSEKYAIRRFATSKLNARGRYVRFLVMPFGAYVFVDEIEVFRGPAALLSAQPTGKPVGDVKAFFAQSRIMSGVRRRFGRDIEALERAIDRAALAEAAKKPLLDRLARTRAALIPSAAELPFASFRTVLPFNEAHAELFRIQAALWKASKRPALSAWATTGWDPLDPFEAIPATASKPVEVHTMRGEYRSAAFNLANATDKPMRVAIRFDGIAGGQRPAYITVHEVPWTDTVSGRTVAAALPEAQRRDDAWAVTVLPGLLRQVWLTVHVTELPPGKQAGDVVLEAEGVEKVTLPLRLHVYPLTFPSKTTLRVGGWSYTDGKGSRGVTAQNRNALLEHLQSRFVNAPWGTPAVLLSYKFEKTDPPTIKLDTQRFDDWIKQWPHAEAYLVFISVGENFAGTKIGTDAFNQRVGMWISAWVRHLKTKAIRPDQLGLLIVDEPHAYAQDDIIIPWAKAITAAEPDVVIWEDPIWRDPRKARPELFEVCDVLCPNRPMWLSAGQWFGQFYLDQKKAGRTLQLYSCSGPSRLLDPYAYYRLQAWHCWQIGGTGSYFWALSDTGGASSWNEYTATHGPYTPHFMDERTVTPAKQMEAIRESAEDYEYFVMLKKAIDKAKQEGKADAAEQAQTLLKAAVDDVLNFKGPTNLTWHQNRDRTKADAARVKLLKALTALQPSK